MKTLHKNKPNELQISMQGNTIIVKDKSQIAQDKLRQEFYSFIADTLFVGTSCFILGACLTYIIMN